MLPIFPSTIDTVAATGITKTILLASDTNSRVLTSPAIVSLNSVKDNADFQSFSKSYLPVAVLLEGKFNSLYANRLTVQVQDSVAKALGKPFAAVADTSTKQIVVSDADIVTNTVSATTGPIAMGMLPFENYRFANREFLLNSVDYLVSNNGIFESRNKDFTLRLLDKKKVESLRTNWQFINIGLPILLVLLFGGFSGGVKISMRHNICSSVNKYELQYFTCYLLKPFILFSDWCFYWHWYLIWAC